VFASSSGVRFRASAKPCEARVRNWWETRHHLSVVAAESDQAQQVQFLGTTTV
jgi:hypothetical protein